MSPHLHIQLYRHQKTTRRPRWVVWLLVGLCLFSLLFCFVVSNLWFTRATILKAAPEGTAGTAQLFLNSQTWPILEKTLLLIPLISNRNMTMNDVRPFTLGEIAWFFNENGSRSVAIRSREELIPTELLDAQHIVVQKISSSIFLLSDTLQPISGYKAKRNVWIPSFEKRLGWYFGKDSDVPSKITFKNGRSISIVQKGNNVEYQNKKRIPSNAFLFLRTPVLSKSIETFQIELFSSIVSPILADSTQALFENFLQSPGMIVLINPIHPKFLLTTEQFMDEKDRVRLIQSILSLKFPSISPVRLVDQSVMSEIVSDPSLISVEQRTIQGQNFHHATIGSNSLYISKVGSIILSNDEELLKTWLVPDGSEVTSEFCLGNQAFLSFPDLIESNTFPTNIYSPDFFQLFSSSFKAFAIETSRKQMKMNFCY